MPKFIQYSGQKKNKNQRNIGIAVFQMDLIDICITQTLKNKHYSHTAHRMSSKITHIRHKEILK